MEEIEILYFSAGWCNPCKKLSADLEASDIENIRKINIEIEDDLVEKYAIRSVPTLIFLYKQEEFGRHTGTISPEDLKVKISEQLKNVVK